MNDGFKSLKVYGLVYKSVMEIFEFLKKFPKEETYSLTDQIRRSSRSICSNIAEAYRKRRYPKHFNAKISDADGEAGKTIVWLNFAKDCNYISSKIYESLIFSYLEVGKMLVSMANNPEKFKQK